MNEIKLKPKYKIKDVVKFNYDTKDLGIVQYFGTITNIICQPVQERFMYEINCHAFSKPIFILESEVVPEDIIKISKGDIVYHKHNWTYHEVMFVENDIYVTVRCKNGKFETFHHSCFDKI